MISIIVPVYNVEKYIRKCVHSLLQQTCNDIEILLIDDGSTDSSGEICDEFQQNYPNKVRVFHRENRGVSAARNIGLKYAQGEYVGFVDSDDWVEPEMFEVLISNIKKYNAQLSICSLRADFDEGGTILSKASESSILDNRELMHVLLTNKSVLGYSCNKLFVTKLANEIGFDESLYICEDMDFCVRYAQHINTTAITYSELYHYRQSTNPVLKLSYSPKLLSLIKAYEKILPIYQKAVPEQAYLVEKNLLKQHLNVIGRMIISKTNDSTLLKDLRKRADELWEPVMRDKRNSPREKFNIFITKMFPGKTLRIKQWVIKHHSK